MPGMYDIPQRLDEATTKVAEEAVEEAYDDSMMAVATKGNSVKIQYHETVDKQQVVLAPKDISQFFLRKMVKYCTNKLHYLKRQWRKV